MTRLANTAKTELMKGLDQASIPIKVEHARNHFLTPTHSVGQGNKWVDAINIFKYGRVYPNRNPVVLLLCYTIFLSLMGRFAGWREAYFPLGLNSSTMSGLSFVMAFMVSFRLNECYQRWYEARTGLRRLASVSNDICRLTCVYIAQESNGGLKNDLVQLILGLVVAFPIALKNNLRGAIDQTESDLRKAGLRPRHIQQILDGQNGPRTWRWIVTLMSGCINQAAQRKYISWEIVRELEDSIKSQTNTGGLCVRIATTPLNFAVSVHVRSVLVLFFLMLPIACISNDIPYGWTIVLVSVTQVVILTVDEIAVEMETPFGNEAVDLPLEAFCNEIIENTFAFAQWDVGPCLKLKPDERPSRRASSPPARTGIPTFSANI